MREPLLRHPLIAHAAEVEPASPTPPPGDEREDGPSDAETHTASDVVSTQTPFGSSAYAMVTDEASPETKLYAATSASCTL